MYKFANHPFYGFAVLNFSSQQTVYYPNMTEH